MARGLNVNDFRKIAPNGFGDPYNSYPHSMAWFREHLYVGTSRANFAHRGRLRQADFPDQMGSIWPVRITESRWELDMRAQIWSFHPPTRKWKKVFTSPMVRRRDVYTGKEIDVPITIGFRTMVTFRGVNDSAPALYVPTASTAECCAVMLRSIDGVNFDVVTEEGMGFPEEYQNRGVRALTAFKDRLFTSPIYGRKGKTGTGGGEGIYLHRYNDDIGNLSASRRGLAPGMRTSLRGSQQSERLRNVRI